MEYVRGHRLGALVGEGGTARVYGAEDGAGRCVAVKLLRPELRDDLTLRKRLAREGEALGRLHHPHVVRLVEAGEDAVAGPFVVTVRSPGPRLSEVLAEAPDGLEVERACRIVIQVLEGLGALHDAGVVHRDLKPDNVFVEPRDGREHVVLFDLGSCAVDGAAALTAVGRVMGSPEYASPERRAGGRADPQTDLWAAGVLLYVCLSGVEPFAGELPASGATAAAAAAPTPLEAVRRSVPRSVRTVVHRALESSPTARYPDASAMATALRDAADGVAR